MKKQICGLLAMAFFGCLLSGCVDASSTPEPSPMPIVNGKPLYDNSPEAQQKYKDAWNQSVQEYGH